MTVTTKCDEQLENEALELYNSDKSIFCFIVQSAGCIGRSGRFRK